MAIATRPQGLTLGSARSAVSLARALPLLLGVVSCLLALVQVVQFPLYAKPDELFHLRNALYLRSQGALPVAPLSRGEARQFPLQEAHQPPLYYALVALATLPVPAERATSGVDRNPYFLATPSGNLNGFTPLYSGFPPAPWAWALYLGRSVSVLFGGLAVLAAWATARSLAPGGAAAVGLALFALNPQVIFLASSLSNDMAGAALAAMALAWLLRAARHGLSPRGALGLGALIGLAVLAKVGGIGLLALLPAWLLVAARRRLGPPAVLLARAALMAAGCLLLCGWWLLRNWLVYGDPLALAPIVAFLGRRTAPFTPAEWLDLAWLVWRTSWLDLSQGAIFFADDRLHLLLLGVAGAGVLGCIASLGRPGRRGEVLLCALWIVVVVAGYARLAPQTNLLMGGGRLLLPAMPAAAALLGRGLAALPLGPLAPPLGAGLMMGLAGLALWAPGWGAAHYPPPERVSLHEVPALPAHPILLGAEISLLGARSEIVADGIRVSLYWRAERAIAEPYTVFVQALDAEGRLVAQVDSYPVGGGYPTHVWTPGEIVVDRHRLALALLPPGGRLIAGLYRRADGRRLSAVTAAGEHLAGDAVPLPPPEE